MNRHERRKADAQWRKGTLDDGVGLTMTPQALNILQEMQAEELRDKPADDNQPLSDNTETQ